MPWGWRWGRRGAQLAAAPLAPTGMTLAMVPPGTRVRVVGIAAGRGAYAKLLSLGIAPGREVVVVDNRVAYPWAPVIVWVGGVEVAVGRGLAAKVIVEPVGGGGRNGEGGQGEAGPSS